MKKIPLVVVLAVAMFTTRAQLPSPALIGYWQNWNSANAPYIPLDKIDPRYNVIEIAFAVASSQTDMSMVFTPYAVSPETFTSQVQLLQDQGRKVLISIGGANSPIELGTTAQKNAFVNSMTSILDTYGFDGMDIDIEQGGSIQVTGGSISSPANVSQQNLIAAIREIMANYRITNHKKLILTMAPETAFVQGGQSSFWGIWGGYLPIIDALRDSLDVVQVQLYNSGSMYGTDGKIYTQGTPDFIVAMTEAVIQGFSTLGGMFQGLPASKVAVSLPACPSAAGGGYTDPESVKVAIRYLRGEGGQPGSYVLTNPGGYPALRGMMTWSINWDATGNCGGEYEYAANFERIFGVPAALSIPRESVEFVVYPNPSNGRFTLALPFGEAEIFVFDQMGQPIIHRESSPFWAKRNSLDLMLENEGVYQVLVSTRHGIFIQKLIIRQ